MTHAVAATFAALAALAGAAAHAVETLERAYELELEHLTLPASASGAVGIEPCSGCSQHRHTLTERTRYSVDGRTLTFEELRRAAADGRRAGRKAFAAVFIDVATGRVSRVAVRLEDGQ